MSSLLLCTIHMQLIYKRSDHEHAPLPIRLPHKLGSSDISAKKDVTSICDLYTAKKRVPIEAGTHFSGPIAR